MTLPRQVRYSLVFTCLFRDLNYFEVNPMQDRYSYV